MSSILAYAAILFTVFVNAATNAMVVTQPTKLPNTTESGISKRQLARLPVFADIDHSRGAQDAQVTLIEYGGLQDPFGKMFHPTMQQVMKEYDGKVRWVYRHFPLSFHVDSDKAAEAAECVAKDAGNDAFWKFIDGYYDQSNNSGNGLAKSQWVGLIESAGANKEAVQSCLDSGEMKAKIDEQVRTGQRAGVSGTPTTFIVTKEGTQDIIPGAVPYAQVKVQLDKYIK